MAETSGAKKPAMPGQEDRISSLPDGVLEDILGFLPADNAVQTSVLSRRWRHLWKSTRRLRLNGLDPGRIRAPAFRNFLYRLLLLRNTSVALDEVELTVYPCGEDGASMNACIQLLLFCRAKMIAVNGATTFDGPPLLSQHLRRLVLDSLDLDANSLDFERCPALEDLRITNCDLDTHRILSQSVTHLSITDCFFNPTRVHIRAPLLVSLELSHCYGKAPLLDRMPSLETAVFSISTKDYCDGASADCSGACLNCCNNNDQNTGDILGGLSNTMKLELRIFYGTLILGRRCPKFSRLKALLLKVPGQANDLHSIVCILGRSPVLEKLTLQLSEGDKWTGESEGMYQTRDQLPAISQLLDTVEIKCREVDERVCFIMKFLSRFIKHININLNGIP